MKAYLLLFCLVPILLRSAVPAPSPVPPGVAEAISGLGSDSFQGREKAQKNLLALAETAHPQVLEACLRASITNQDVEVQMRLEEVMLQVVDQKIFNSPRGFLGIRLLRDTVLVDGKQTPAILASEVLPDTGAAKAGVEAGDYIIACDGKPIPEDPTTTVFIQYVQSHPPGAKVNIEVVRGEKKMKFDVTLGGRPAEARGFFSSGPVQSLEDFFHEWRDQECQRLGLPRE
jgi:predicted metalloprotease with PDZ domain